MVYNAQCVIQLNWRPIIGMSKRKLEINEVKKITLRGRKQKTITTKYEVALSFFKNKDQKNVKIFNISFEPLIFDLLDQLANVELVSKLETQSKEEVQAMEVTEEQIRLEGQSFKNISKEFPIDQIIKCISIKKDLTTKTISLEIVRSKLMLFFKHIRGIYPEFCFCVGEKIIIEPYDLKAFYEVFKVEWAKLNERGRMTVIEKIEKLVCRSLYFVGALVENNIFQEIQEQENKKREEVTDSGTKSEKKKNVKGINQQVSSTYSFGSTDMLSNFSYGLKSQQSNQHDFYRSGYSEKSEKIVRKQRCLLWQKVEIKNVKVKLTNQPIVPTNEQSRFEIDLLSNDVENILIEQAFKIQKLKDACQRNKFDINSPYPYQAYLNYYHPSYYSPYQSYQQMQGYQYPHPSTPSQDSDLYNIRRSFNVTNLVETRKTYSRMGGNKYS